jgi:hypothetical protein
LFLFSNIFRRRERPANAILALRFSNTNTIVLIAGKQVLLPTEHLTEQIRWMSLGGSQELQAQQTPAAQRRLPAVPVFNETCDWMKAYGGRSQTRCRWIDRVQMHPQLIGAAYSLQRLR